MRSDELLVTEIFHSIQGETTLSGERFAFIRLTGCNLRCAYCDSVYAFKGKNRKTVEQILEEIRPYRVSRALITGGEPLLQKGTPQLLAALTQEGYEVSIETHGEHPIDAVAGKARIIMDIKTPGSGMNRGGFRKNLPLLGARDEIKFVITSRDDYHWARDLVSSGSLPQVNSILFSPALPMEGTPGKIEGLELRWLAEKIIEDRLPVRLQVQLHKLIWGAESRGV